MESTVTIPLFEKLKAPGAFDCQHLGTSFTLPKNLCLKEADEITAWLNFLSQYRRIFEARWAQYDGPMI